MCNELKTNLVLFYKYTCLYTQRSVELKKIQIRSLTFHRKPIYRREISHPVS